jgi:hypothetical protein
VNPILPAIPSNISAILAATPAPQAVSGPRGPGGFASTLAAAQSSSALPQTAVRELKSSDELVAKSAGTGTNLNGSMLAPGNSKSKKLLNNSPVVSPSAAAVTSSVDSQHVPVANQLPPLTKTSLQTSASNAAIPSAVLNDPALTQTEPNQTEPNQTEPNQTVPNQTVPVANQPAESSGLLTSLQTAAGSLSDSATWNVVIPDYSALVTAEPTLLAENTQPASVPTAAGQLASSTGLPNASLDNQSGEFFTNGRALELVEPMLQPDQRIESGSASTTLLANAKAETGGATGEQLVSAANLKISGTSAGNATTPDTAQTDLLAQMVLNSPAQAVPGKPSLSPAARATAEVTNQIAHGAGQGTEVPAPTSISSSALSSSAFSTGSESGNGSTMASQTPFSIFFSGPGPGAESAASALPKMMLPVSNSAIRGHATGADATSNPQPGSLQGGIRPNSAPQNTKEPTPGTESASLQSAQPLRRDADPSANLQVVSPQITTTPGPAPQSSAGVTVPISGQAAPAGDSLPKPQTLPAGSSGSPAPLIPAAPEPAALGAVQVAQLVTRLGQSEMRIGLNTAAFGSVEVRTVVRTSDVGLVIGSEKGDLRALLANEMPAITNTLQQQNLRLNSVNFMQGFAFSNNASGGGDSQQRSFVPMRASADSASSDAPREDSGESHPAARWGETSISILA